MDSGGGGTTQVTQNPPQLLPQGEEGYNLSQDYYKNILRNPPTYGGPRVAPINPTQEEAMARGRQIGTTMSPEEDSARRQNFATTEGDYLYDPNAGYGYRPTSPGYEQKYRGNGDELSDISLIKGGLDKSNQRNAPVASASAAAYNPSAGWTMPSDEEIQKFVSSASQPYMRQLEESTLPSIQSDFGVAGGGVNNTREQITKQDAINRNSATIGTEVIAPIFSQMQTLDEQFKNAEREREAAIASGDADRFARASEASARIQADVNNLNAELDSRMRIAGSDISSQGRRAQASNVLQSREGQRNRDLEASRFQNQNRLDAWNQERNRQVGAVGNADMFLTNDLRRNEYLKSIGDYERAFNQESIQAQKEAWAEPINTQANAANALFGASGMGPGSASSVVDQGDNTFGQIMQMISTAAMIYAMS